jgi:hypothetical protein
MKMNYKEKVVDGKVTSDIAMNPISLEDNFLSSNVEIIGDDYKLSFSLPLDKIGYKPEVGIRFNAFRIETLVFLQIFKEIFTSLSLPQNEA